MSFTIEQMNAAVEAAVEKQVSYKIDRVTSSINELRSDFKTHCILVEPIIEQFKDRKGFKNTFYSFGKSVGVVSGLLAGLGLIVAFLVKVFNAMSIK